MTSAVEKNAQGAILAQATFTYDALGNRIGMDENGVQTWTLYDGNTPVLDFTSSGSLATRYLNGPAGDLVDTVLARELSNGTVAWYLADHLGTVRDVINNSGGIIDHVDYSAFGTTLDESSPSNGDRMTGFAGLQRDTVTGLNLAVFRVQNPETGRWTSQDPLGFAAGDLNLYRYVGNGSTDRLDSTGLQPPPVTVGGNGWFSGTWGKWQDWYFCQGGGFVDIGEFGGSGAFRRGGGGSLEGKYVQNPVESTPEGTPKSEFPEEDEGGGEGEVTGNPIALNPAPPAPSHPSPTNGRGATLPEDWPFIKGGGEPFANYVPGLRPNPGTKCEEKIHNALPKRRIEF